MADALITLNQTLGSEYAANVLCFSNVREDENQLQAIADAIRFEYETHVRDVLSTSWSLDSIDVSFLGDTEITYTVNVPFTDGPLAGADPDDILPTQCALLASTSYVGPKPNRGRIYFMGLTENNTEDGVWTAPTIGRFALLVDEFVQGIVSAPDTVFLRILGRPIPDKRPTYISSPVQLATIRGRVATQRRRRRGD